MGFSRERPEELLPDEQTGDYNGGVIFEGSKGKMIGNYAMPPILLPTSRMKEVTLPPPNLSASS